jgi:DNA-directed RNA polymerase subunit RPC12/RpoP
MSNSVPNLPPYYSFWMSEFHFLLLAPVYNGTDADTRPHVLANDIPQRPMQPTEMEDCRDSMAFAGVERKEISGHLAMHKRIHTGALSYSCDTCGKSFSRQSGLTRHMLTHTGALPYSCDICGKSFSQNSSVTIHMRTHTGARPYSCDTCGKSFSTNGNLTQHMRTHTGARSYSCDICGKSFSQNSHLTIHMRTHTGARPYSCDTCGKSFSTNGHLTQHMRSCPTPATKQQQRVVKTQSCLPDCGQGTA